MKIPSSIKLDPAQIGVIAQLEEIHIKNNTFFVADWIQGFFCKSKKLRQYLYDGIYLYGSVGRGKTMIMKSFYKRCVMDKQMVHYQPFIQSMHKEMHKIQSTKYVNNMADYLAKEISNTTKLVCIDELEIQDITDAMLIRRLFAALKKYKVFIFVTSNKKPDHLYRGGIQRESFLPCIEMIKHSYAVLHLDDDHDYRMDQIADIAQQCFCYDGTASSNIRQAQKSQAKIHKIKMILTKGHIFNEGNINLFGRKVKFKHMHNGTLLTSFTELFERPLGVVDYVEICKYFDTILIEDVRNIKENEGDIITRFINFIDNAYFYKVQLFMGMQVPLDAIYKKGSRKDSFQRTLSRLNEMNNINLRS